MAPHSKVLENGNYVSNGDESDDDLLSRKIHFSAGNDWIDLLRQQSKEWGDKPLIVLSLFDGIGAIWAALTLLGIPFVGYSSEINPDAIKLVQMRHPSVKHLGDVQSLKKEDIKEKIDVIIGGFPCQDLSSMGKKAGLHGEQSKLFFDLLRVLEMYRPHWFLVENVASMGWVDREEISKYLGCLPIELDSQDLTPSRRRRLYWTSIPYPESLPKVRDHFSTSLQSVLENATALHRKSGVILSSSSRIGKQGTFEHVLDDDGSLRDITIRELERIMGFPAGYTDFDQQSLEADPPNSPKSRSSTGNSKRNSNGKSSTRKNTGKRDPSPDSERPSGEEPTKNSNVRWRLMGNSFSVKVIAYLLSPLIKRSVRESKHEYVLPFKQIQESECSVIHENELWAFYNGQGLPNWYGVIVKRSGSRFSKSKNGNSKNSVRIEMKFLELTYGYDAEESDERCPDRGTGRYRIRREAEVQDSWFSFSHRVKTYHKSQHCYFIYPGATEVWAINFPNRGKSCPFYVYVVESKFNNRNKKKFETAKPGTEGFWARCRVLQRSVQREVYRITDKELVYEDLSVFVYSAPYHYKDEEGVVKIEICHLKESEYVQGHGERTSKRRRANLVSDDEAAED